MPRGVVKVPQVMQMESSECGAACLAMILAYFGRWVPLEQLRVDCGVSRDGAKASAIMDAAEGYGLAVKGFAYSVEGIRTKVTFPCVIYWNFNHFVVLDGFSGKHAYLNDPARGEVRVSMEEFESSFTGIAITFQKTDAFEEGGAKPDTLTFIRRRLKGLGGPIFFVMATAALTSIISIVSSSISRIFLDSVLTMGNVDILLPLVALVAAVALVSCVVGVLDAVELMRIMTARAVCGNRKIIILDEVTSALDNVTQRQVTDSLEQLGCTRVVVAHRLSTVRRCDRILVLDGGRIAEEGTYDELMDRGGIFAELVARQRLEGE